MARLAFLEDLTKTIYYEILILVLILIPALAICAVHTVYVVVFNVLPFLSTLVDTTMDTLSLIGEIIIWAPLMFVLFLGTRLYESAISRYGRLWKKGAYVEKFPELDNWGYKYKKYARFEDIGVKKYDGTDESGITSKEKRAMDIKKDMEWSKKYKEYQNRINNPAERHEYQIGVDGDEEIFG